MQLMGMQMEINSKEVERAGLVVITEGVAMMATTL
jgi:hypothetical protein